MTMTPEDLDLHKRLLSEYEHQASLALQAFQRAAESLRILQDAVDNQQRILREAGVYIDGTITIPASSLRPVSPPPKPFPSVSFDLDTGE